MDHLEDKVKKSYDALFEKFKEIDDKPVVEWNTNHLLGYFVKKYLECYKVPYQFKFDKPQASKCQELFAITRLKMNISSDPQILKDYIDFAFEKRAKKSKRRLTSITFMIADFLTIEFKQIYQIKASDSETVGRTTPLPNKVLGFFVRQKIQATTYGHLAFLIESGQYDHLKPELLSLGLDYDKVKERIV